MSVVEHDYQLEHLFLKFNILHNDYIIGLVYEPTLLRKYSSEQYQQGIGNLYWKTLIYFLLNTHQPDVYSVETSTCKDVNGCRAQSIRLLWGITRIQPSEMQFSDFNHAYQNKMYTSPAYKHTR